MPVAHHTHRVIHQKRSGFQSGKATTGHGEEIEVVPPPKRIALAAPDYFTVDLPYAIFFHYRVQKSATGNTVRQFSLNGIADPDLLSGSSKQPMGRDTWAQVYQYYRVLGSTCSVKIVNHGTLPAPETDTNRDVILAGLEWNTDSTNFVTTENAFMEAKQTKAMMIPGAGGFPNLANIGHLKHEYTPEAWHYHVDETGVEERWTPIAENPADSHIVAFRLFPSGSDDNAAGNLYNIDYVFNITYTVQFREAFPNVINIED